MYYLGPSVLIQLLLLTVPFFAGHSTTLLLILYVISFLLDVKFWQMDQVFASAILATFLLHMHITGHTCTSSLNIDSKFEFFMSSFAQNLLFFVNLAMFWTMFGHFVCAYPEIAIRLLLVQNLTPDLSLPCPTSYKIGNFVKVF